MFNNYPYGDLHEINLDWFLKQFQALKALVNNMDAMLTALQSLPDASGASDGQVLTADGNGGWAWEDPQSGGGTDIPDSVKQAINTVLQNVAFDDNQTYTTELSIIQAWAGQTPADSVTLSANSGSAVIGGTITITASTTGTGTLQAVSSDTGVATVAVNGNTITITAVAAGSATITVTYGTASATYSATVTAQQITYTITNSLTNVTNSNAAVSVNENDSYTASLTADQGYTLDAVTVTMGGSDVTSTVYNAGAITIAAVTGNVVITASAIAVNDTTVQISQQDTKAVYQSTADNIEKANYVSVENCGVTIVYELPAATTSLYPAGILPFTTNVFSTDACLFALDADGNHVNHVNIYTSSGRWAQAASGTLVEFKQEWTINSYSKVFLNVDTRHLDDSYMYDYTTGQIWFAGVNTPYYGMSNVSEAE